ncbi:MAG: hypothetical protein R3Y24_14435 [Eubacteriales bacterium]
MQDNDEDIVVTIRGGRASRVSQQSDIQFTISNFELQELYDKVSSKKSEGLELFSDTGYEMGVDLDSIMRNQEIPIVSNDKINGIKYQLHYPTVEYSLYLLMLIIDTMNAQQGRSSRVLPMRLRRPMDVLRIFDDPNEITFLNLLPHIIGELSLQITSINRVSNTLSKFRKHKTSFVFDFMYRSNIALIEYTDILDMFRMNSTIRERFDITQINTPPLREYNADVVDYYKLALSSHDSYIKYISFYHVLEYFFDEVFKKKIVNDLKDKITHPDFSYKNDKELYEVAKFVRNRWHMNDESGQGNELESLKYVLNEYINIEDLKTRISAIDSSAVTFYQGNKVSFCNAPIVSWSDSQGAYIQLAKRIYYTRNSLVHSKSGKNKERYRPYKDEKQLHSEIPLLRAIAELIIINSSQIV